MTQSFVTQPFLRLRGIDLLGVIYFTPKTVRYDRVLLVRMREFRLILPC